MIIDHATGNDGQITHGRDVLGIRQTGCILKHGVDHAHARSLFIHRVNKGRLAARHCFG